MWFQFLGLLLLTCSSVTTYAEVLVHISDETANTETATTPVRERIIYRVICAEGEEQLPDCLLPPIEDSFAESTGNASIEKPAPIPASPIQTKDIAQEQRQTKSKRHKVHPQKNTKQ